MTRDQLSGKIDYQQSDEASLFGRMLFGFSDNPSPFEFTPDNVLNARRCVDAEAYMFTVGSTYLISATHRQCVSFVGSTAPTTPKESSRIF